MTVLYKYAVDCAFYSKSGKGEMIDLIIIDWTNIKYKKTSKRIMMLG